MVVDALSVDIVQPTHLVVDHSVRMYETWTTLYETWTDMDATRLDKFRKQGIEGIYVYRTRDMGTVTVFDQPVRGSWS
jgi:hypothetical protein